MNFKTRVGRTANRVLGRFGLEISPITMDFDARLVSAKHLDRMFAEISRTASDYFSSQDILVINHRFDIEREIKSFYESFLRSPFRLQKGGSRFGNLLWLDLIAKSLQPDVIIDSGTYLGASAWALSQGAPDSRILSFDIDQSRLLLRGQNVEYIERDWTSVNFDAFGARTSLCYFDDHVDQGRRLKEAADRRFQTLLFDDDFSVLDFVRMAHGGSALPKISFVLDPKLDDGEMIEWINAGRHFTWKVDRAHLDGLKSLIKAADRLPSLGAPLGIEQLPYRIVALTDGVAQDISDEEIVTAHE